MATKVEELRARMLGNDPCYDMDDEGNMIQKGTVPHCIGIKAEELDSLIAAAREEGRAEERERIVCGSQRFPKGEYVVDSDYISMVFSPDGIGEAMTDCELFIIPASLLAPDKESEK